MPARRSLIAPSTNPLLEHALREKLLRRSPPAGSLGELEPLALRLGLMQNTLRPRFSQPQLVVFAADHGLAVDGITAAGQPTTQEEVLQLRLGRGPMAVFARTQGVELSVVDCGIAANLPAHDRMLMRKIAHGTRNTRVGPAMSLEQAHAAMRAGMEIGESLRGNVLMCAGLGVGAHESAALVVSRLTDTPIRELVTAGPMTSEETLAHLLITLQGAQGRHRQVTDPIEVLAAFGGFEVAVMVGVMLVAASKRHLIMVDGMAACAALMVAARIATPVTDYCIFCRSRSHRGLDRTLGLFRASALLELGLESADGTGAVLAWPLVRNAAALLTEVGEGEDPGPSQPAAMSPAPESVPVELPTQPADPS
ncbi:MAG: nicotinate-nucleotide--dimethylbenzimidazole phosphoribosyltransferase [Rubrivivax sp.]|nr:nicotinate-nucleotide--dimethylbenzimidazole phosphoribosyltransferase [Rubrivivax sp.]